MNWNFQRKQIKPTAKHCTWCKHLYKCNEVIFGFEVEKCELENTTIHLKTTHRQDLKIIREEDFRYCKNYRYSKTNFNAWKTMCKENAEAAF